MSSGARLLGSVLLSCVVVSASAQPPRATPFLGGEVDSDTIATRLDASVPRRFRAIGTSSVTLRIDFGPNAGDAAFKPRTRTHPRGFTAEVAAYRIARQLGLDNVPPVVTRRLPRPLVESRFESEHPEDWEAIRREILWDAPGFVRGAAIYWIPAMERSDLDTMEGLGRATPWLAIDGAIPEGRDATARDLSTMIAFDYLIGNWDRFSGGNVSADASGRLFMRDHNVAFAAPLVDGRYARVRAHLERVERFSRAFVAHVEALDRESLDAALLDEGEPLLGPAQITGVLTRARALLSYVAALAALHGADAVLPWE